MADFPADREFQSQTDHLQTLNEIGRVVSSTLDLQRLYETIYRQIGRVMDTTQFFIALRQADAGCISIPYLREEGKLLLDQEVPDEKSITTLVMDRGTPLLFETTAEFDRFQRENGLPTLIVGEHDSQSGIFVPLNTGRRTIGTLTVQSSRPHAYTEDDVQTLSVIASQAAIAIENARLYARSQDSVRQMAALLHVAQMINGSLDLQTVLDAILSGMRDVVPYYLASILLPDYSRGHLDIVGTVGRLAEEWRETVKIPFGVGVTGTVFATGKPLIVPDVTQYPGYIGPEEPIGSEMAAPLKRGDVVIGVLNVEREEVGGFSPDELNLLQVFASQAAIAIENARLYRQQEQRAVELATIQSIVQKLTPLHDVHGIAEVINRELKALIDYHSCRLFVLAPDEHTLVPISQADFDPQGLTLQIGEGITGSIAERGVSELIGNTLADPRGSQIVGTPVREESMIGAPLIYEGKVRGVMTLSKLGIDQFDHNALRLLDIIAAQTAMALDRARLYEELRLQAMTDELTHLYNRRYLLQRAREEQARAIRNHHNLLALMLDIDAFKRVNDQWGHDAGDVVLQELARLIRDAVRAEDIVARYGGEEFCVLLPEIPVDDAVQVAERLRQGIASHRLPKAAGARSITVSVGMAQAVPEEDEAQLFTRADQAMYEVKRLGGNRVCLADEQSFHVYAEGEALAGLP